MTIWRVNLNPKLWDQSQFEALWHERYDMRTFAQSKGRCRMKIVPVKGDVVMFVWKKNIVMKGIVQNDGFITNTYHQEHPCNRGPVRAHAEHPEFTWVTITEVGLHIPFTFNGQRTWAKYNQ